MMRTRRAGGGWSVVMGVVVLAAALLAAPSCGSDAETSQFDAGSESLDASVAKDAREPEPFVEAATFDAAPVVRSDFEKPVFDVGAAPDSVAIFASADVDAGGGGGACLFEPELGSLFPNNWLRPRFRFTSASAENLFEIRLDVKNQTKPLVIYTSKRRYTLEKAAWAFMTKYGVGAVHVTLRSATLDAAGKLSGGPWKGSEGDIEIAPVDARGSIAYWTTSNGTVLKGFQVGDEGVQPVISPAQAETKCVACHTSTPDGLYVGLTTSDDPGNGSVPAYVGIRSVDGKGTEPPFLSASAKTLLRRQDQHAPSFSGAHWAPGDRIALSMLNTGGREEIVWTDLEARSIAQGAAWDIVHRQGDETHAASGASFSHDGKKLVYVSTTSSGAGTIVGDGQLWTVPFANRQGGQATPVPGASDPGHVQYYPVFSQNDLLLAFNRVGGGMSSYNNAQAEVFIVPAAGGTPTRLAANDPPTCLSIKSPGVTNSWPKWSPEVTELNGTSYYFLVFSSTRNAATNGPQLYVAPITITRGVIKTYSALYFWNQPELEHNHTPAWDVFKLPPPPVN